MTQEQTDEMLEAARPLIKWLSRNCHPHTLAVVTAVDVEVLEGVACATTHEFVRG